MRYAKKQRLDMSLEQRITDVEARLDNLDVIAPEPVPEPVPEPAPVKLATESRIFVAHPPTHRHSSGMQLLVHVTDSVGTCTIQPPYSQYEERRPPLQFPLQMYDVLMDRDKEMERAIVVISSTAALHITGTSICMFECRFVQTCDRNLVSPLLMSHSDRAMTSAGVLLLPSMVRVPDALGACMADDLWNHLTIVGDRGSLQNKIPSMSKFHVIRFIESEKGDRLFDGGWYYGRGMLSSLPETCVMKMRNKTNCEVTRADLVGLAAEFGARSGLSIVPNVTLYTLAGR